MDDRKVFNHVSPNKDVDGFNATNLGLLCQENEDAFASCTPAGILELLKRTKVDTTGKHVVVLGRSLIVGKPVGMLLLQKGVPRMQRFTYCHSRTPDLANHTRQADILIAAIGKPHFVDKSMVKPGAIVIDVGINRIPDESRKSASVWSEMLILKKSHPSVHISLQFPEGRSHDGCHAHEKYS